MARLILICVIWLLQIAAVLLLVDADWVNDQAAAERQQASAYLGESLHNRIEHQSQSMYHRLFEGSGFVTWTYERLLPDPRHRELGDLAPWFFVWLERRIDTGWVLIRQALLRVLMIREWSVVIVLLVLPPVIDGITLRRIHRHENRLVSADRYLAARRLLFLALSMPLFYLTLPFAIAPAVVPAWGGLLALTCHLLFKHAQHRV